MFIFYLNVCFSVLYQVGVLGCLFISKRNKEKRILLNCLNKLLLHEKKPSCIFCIVGKYIYEVFFISEKHPLNVNVNAGLVSSNGLVKRVSTNDYC